MTSDCEYGSCNKIFLVTVCRSETISLQLLLIHGCEFEADMSSLVKKMFSVEIFTLLLFLIYYCFVIECISKRNTMQGY